VTIEGGRRKQQHQQTVHFQLGLVNVAVQWSATAETGKQQHQYSCLNDDSTVALTLH